MRESLAQASIRFRVEADERGIGIVRSIGDDITNEIFQGLYLQGMPRYSVSLPLRNPSLAPSAFEWILRLTILSLISPRLALRAAKLFTRCVAERLPHYEPIAMGFAVVLGALVTMLIILAGELAP